MHDYEDLVIEESKYSSLHRASYLSKVMHVVEVSHPLDPFP